LIKNERYISQTLGSIETKKELDSGWCNTLRNWDGTIENLNELVEEKGLAYEEVKQTPYEYLLDFYGLEEGKSYFEDSCTWSALSTNVLLAKMMKNQISIERLMNGNLGFTEIKPKKTVTLELTDEQLSKIKEMLGE